VPVYLLRPKGFQQGTHSTYEPRGSKCQKREPRGSIVAGLTPRQTGPFRYYSEEGRLRGLGTRKTREAITRFEGRFPEIFKSIEPVLYQIGTRHGCVALEAELEETTAQLSRLDLNLTLDDQALKDFAEAKSRSCAKQCKAFGYTERTENHIKQILDGYALPYPKPKGSSVQSRLKRTEDSKWWRRSVRKLRGQVLDETARRFGLVSKKRGVYVSDWAYKVYQKNRKRNRELLEAVTAVNELAQEYTLKELSDLSVSNPAIRRSELITRAAGFEKMAKDLGHVGIFFTLTAPSRFHPVKASGHVNPKYQGATVKAAQDYLTRLWSQIRAQLKREDLQVYGFRIVEPHHDGTPHWHLLLFTEPQARNRLEMIFRDYALREDGDEPGAKTSRLKAVGIDEEKGSATGYIVKYICKNIDGNFSEDGNQAEDWFGNDARDASERVGAWAAIHRIRQFQQIGGAPVTVWRELRRLEPVSNELVDSARQAADQSDWATFVELMGGPCAKRAKMPIRAAYWIEFDPDTGEYLDSPKDQYGDDSPGKLFGIQAYGTYWITRHHRWEISAPNRPERKALTPPVADLSDPACHLLAYQEPSQEAVDALPATTAYSWEVMIFGGASPPLEFCQ